MRSIQYLGKVNLPEDGSMKKTMKSVSSNLKSVVKGLSLLVVGDVPDYQERTEKVEEQMLSGTKEELLQAYIVVLELITGRDFFVVCQLAMELANLTVRRK